MKTFPRWRDRFFIWLHQNLPACIVVTIAIGLCVYLFLQALDAEAVRQARTLMAWCLYRAFCF